MRVFHVPGRFYEPHCSSLGWPPLGQLCDHFCPCFAAPSHAAAPRLIATSVPITNNGPTSMSIPKNTQLAAWQLPSLLIPVHQYKKTSIQMNKQSKQRSHFLPIVAYVYRNRFAIATQIQRRFSPSSNQTGQRDATLPNWKHSDSSLLCQPEEPVRSGPKRISARPRALAGSAARLSLAASPATSSASTAPAPKGTRPIMSSTSC